MKQIKMGKTAFLREIFLSTFVLLNWELLTCPIFAESLVGPQEAEDLESQQYSSDGGAIRGLDAQPCGLDLKYGPKFVFDVDGLPDGNSFKTTTEGQSIFLGTQQFYNALNNGSNKIKFAMKIGGECIVFSAFKDADQGPAAMEHGVWSGIVRKGGNPEGELICTLSPEAFGCSIRIFDDAFDIYRFDRNSDRFLFSTMRKFDMQKEESVEESVDSGIQILQVDPVLSLEVLPQDGSGGFSNEPQQDIMILALAVETPPEKPVKILFKKTAGFEIQEESDKDGALILEEPISDDKGFSRRLEESPKGRLQGTEVIAFYTAEAANKFGDWGQLENEIKTRIELFNDALRGKGADTDFITVNLVSTYPVFQGDDSNYKDWIQADLIPQTLHGFMTSTWFENKKNLVGADAMILVHDWETGCGMAKKLSPYALVDVDCLSQHTLQHELGHLFNLQSCYGERLSNQRSLMAYGSAGRLNYLSDYSAFFLGSGMSGSFTTDDSDNCKKKNDGAPCCRHDVSTISKRSAVFDYNTSKAASRLALSVSGSLKGYQWAFCGSGFKSIGLVHRRDEATKTDYHDLQYVCGSNVSGTLNFSSGRGDLISTNILKCGKGGYVQSMYFGAYKTPMDELRLGIKCGGCRNRGCWRLTPKPKGTFVAGYQALAQGDTKRLYYIKMNRYGNKEGTDKYSIDVAFENKSAKVK